MCRQLAADASVRVVLRCSATAGTSHSWHDVLLEQACRGHHIDDGIHFKGPVFYCPATLSVQMSSSLPPSQWKILATSASPPSP